jgi:hypothetical protein
MLRITNNIWLRLFTQKYVGCNGRDLPCHYQHFTKNSDGSIYIETFDGTNIVNHKTVKSLWLNKF